MATDPEESIKLTFSKKIGSVKGEILQEIIKFK